MWFNRLDFATRHQIKLGFRSHLCSCACARPATPSSLKSTKAQCFSLFLHTTFRDSANNKSDTKQHKQLSGQNPTLKQLMALYSLHPPHFCKTLLHWSFLKQRNNKDWPLQAERKAMCKRSSVKPIADGKGLTSTKMQRSWRESFLNIATNLTRICTYEDRETNYGKSASVQVESRPAK